MLSLFQHLDSASSTGWHTNEFNFCDYLIIFKQIIIKLALYCQNSYDIFIVYYQNSYDILVKNLYKII